MRIRKKVHIPKIVFRNQDLFKKKVLVRIFRLVLFVDEGDVFIRVFC
jgi:hypothetical protein